MKKGLIAGAAVAAGIAVAALLLVEREPRTAEEQWVRAERLLLRLEARADLAGPEIQQEQDRVLAAFRAVGEKFPPAPKADRRAIELLAKWKREEEALAASLAFIEKHKDDPAAPDVLWEAVPWARAKAEEVLRLYRMFVDRFPKDPRAPQALLEIALLMKELKTFAPDEIRAVYQEFLDKFPKSDLRDAAMLGIADFYKEAKAFDAAVKEYDKVIEEFEGKESAAKALLEKGKLLAEKMDKKEEARKTLEELEKKHPKTEPARQGGSMRQKLEKDLREEKAEKREDEFLKEHYGLPGGDLLQAMGPPTKVFAMILEQALDLETVDVRARIDPEKKTIAATAAIRLVNRGDRKTNLRFHLLPSLEVSSATVNGAAAKVRRQDQVLQVDLPEALEKAASARVEVTYAGGAPDGAPMRLGKHGYAAPGAYWYPLTVYGDLFTGTMTLDLPSALEARGTGALASSKKEGDSRTHVFAAKEPVFGLFFAYGAYTVTIDGPVTLWTFSEGFALGKETAAAAKEILQFYTDTFGPLPWPRIDLVEADLPEGIGGVSPANVILLSSKVLAAKTVPVSLLAHELAHQWWGNLVPVTLLKEDYAAWLSEGLACYSDSMYLEKAYGPARMEQHLSKAGLIYLERMLDLPDVPLSKCWCVHPQYFAVTYMKGSVVFHMLRRRMGEAAFGAALRDYARDLRYKPGGLADFRAVCEKAGGKPLADFFGQWVDRPGFPSLKVESVDRSGPVRVTVSQAAPAFGFDLTVAFEGEGRRELRSFAVAKETEVLEAALPFRVEKVVLDPAGVLLKRPGPANEWSARSRE